MALPPRAAASVAAETRTASVAPVVPAASMPSQPAAGPLNAPSTTPSVVPAAPAQARKAVSVVPADWDEQLGKPAIRPQPPQPMAPQAAAVPAVAKPMRSLEEVRADLARLRANAKERHKPVPVKRDTHFEPTDFQDFVVPDPRPTPDSYAATAYMGFTVLKSTPASSRENDRNG